MKKAVIQVIIFLVIDQLAAGEFRMVPDRYPTIGDAVNACADGDEVFVADGIYTGNGNCDITINKRITIRSKSGPEGCIIDCNSSVQSPHRAFVVRSGVRIAGFTIVNGHADEGGAISFVSAYTSEIINCIFSKNSAEIRGGAIFCNHSDLTVVNSKFTDNSSLNGGAIYCQSRKLFMSNCIISRNMAIGSNSEADGGGIASQTDVTVQNCTISENIAESNTVSYGGGICCKSNSNLAINNCKIQNNIVRGGYSTRGGGILCFHSSSLILNDSIITGNTCEGKDSSGCGVYCEQYHVSTGKCTITGCTIEDNIATNMEQNNRSYGGGIYLCGARPIISKCIIRNNSANAGAGIRLELANSLIWDCIISGNFSLNRNNTSSGIHCYNSNAYIGNCTIVGNSSYGLYCQDGAATVENSIIYYNGRDNQPEIYGYVGVSVGVGYSDVQGPFSPLCLGVGGIYGNGNINSDPCFIEPGYWDVNGTPKQWEDDFWVEGDYRLSSISPCINTGCFPSYLLDSTDLNGNPRVIGKTDMGAYEFSNNKPIAVAGPDHIVYAYIDGISDVNLDGSDSNDSDSQPLTYTWTWTTDGNTYEANGINPTIQLPVGAHTIELVVNDGIEDSLPDYVDVNVVGPVKGSVKITPQAINLASQGNLIKANIVLPEGFTVDDVDANVPLVVEPMGVRSKNSAWASFFAKKLEATKDKKAHPTNCIEALFDRGELCNGLDNGEQELSVVGQFKSGQYFYGSDVIKVMGKRQ